MAAEKRSNDMEHKIDALRVVQDPEYAAGLTEDQWRILANDPVWNELVGEFYEMTAPVLTRYAVQLGQAAPRLQAAPATPAPRPAVQPASQQPERFDVVGKRVPRL